MSSPPTASSGGHLSPEGRGVGRPIRRRTRASRRTPTTLVKTDAKNFRAMVQHFTAGPNVSASPAPIVPVPHHGVVPNLGFRPGERQAAATHDNPDNSMMMVPPPQAEMFDLQYHHQQQQQQQMVVPQMFQYQNQGYMFSFNNDDPAGGAERFSFKDMGKP